MCKIRLQLRQYDQCWRKQTRVAAAEMEEAHCGYRLVDARLAEGNGGYRPLLRRQRLLMRNTISNDSRVISRCHCPRVAAGMGLRHRSCSIDAYRLENTRKRLALSPAATSSVMPLVLMMLMVMLIILLLLLLPSTPLPSCRHCVN